MQCIPDQTLEQKKGNSVKTDEIWIKHGTQVRVTTRIGFLSFLTNELW